MADSSADLRLAHDVFFTLRDASEEACERLLAGCAEYLSGADGIVSFAAGTRVAEHARDVNDVAYHVSLHIVFESKADHDAYQSAPLHERFIEEHAANWEAVRVCDSYLRVTR